MSPFAGLIPPICTPLAEDRSIDVASLERLISFEIDAGANGIFVLGSSGVVVTAPFYANPSPTEVTEHFRAIREAAAILDEYHARCQAGQRAEVSVGR